MQLKALYTREPDESDIARSHGGVTSVAKSSIVEPQMFMCTVLTAHCNAAVAMLALDGVQNSDILVVVALREATCTENIVIHSLRENVSSLLYNWPSPLKIEV